MGTPQKNFGQTLESPYAKHLPQYPSQSDTFVPNEFGGKMWVSDSTPSKQQYQGNNYQPNSNNWRRGNNRYFNTNRDAGNGNNGRGRGGYRNNYQNNFQNNYDQQQMNRYNNSGNRQQPCHGQRFNKSDGNSRNDYYHPSMLVDPWKELLDRHHAIKNSQINVSTTNEEESSSQQDAIPTTAIETTKTTTTSTSISP